MPWLNVCCGRHCIAAALFCTSFACAGAPRAVDLHLDVNPTPDLIRAVAAVGKSQNIQLTQTANLRDLVTQRCGAPDPTYLALLLDSNSQLKTLPTDAVPAGISISFPACIRTQIAVSHVLQPGETIGKLYAQQGFPLDARALEKKAAALTSQSVVDRTRQWLTGGLDDRTSRGFRATENALAFLAANGAQDFRSLKPGQTYVVPLPYVTNTIALQPGLDVQTASARLTGAMVSSGISAQGRVAQANVASLIGDIDLPLGVCSAPPVGWPIIASQITVAMAENARARPSGTAPSTAKILVLDTGIDSFADWANAIPPAHLGAMLAVDMQSGLPRYRAVNIAMNLNNAIPPDDLPARSHGGEVASVLLGGTALSDAQKASLPITMTFASLAAVDGDGHSFLSAAAISRAFRQAEANAIPIVNASVDAVDGREFFSSALTLAGQHVLFITAAGNDGSAFSSTNLSWPGSFGGDPVNASGGLVVTVGSYDPGGGLLYFSQRGPSYVDLLAPGCAIGTYTRDGQASGVAAKQVARSGTSYSAPLVSMVAGLLSSEGVSPAEIKRRLILSVDIDGALIGSVYSVGRLNIRKALSVWRDYVDFRSGADRQVLTGVVLNRPTGVTICGNTVLLSEIGKMSIAGNSAQPADPKRAYLWVNAASAAVPLSMHSANCLATDLSPGTIDFQDAETGVIHHIALSDVMDLIPRAIDPAK